MSMIKAQIISGSFEQVLVRQKSGQQIEIGELLVSDVGNEKILFQVYNLIYGSQLSQQNLEMIAGMKLEENTNVELFEAHLRNYMIAVLKALIVIREKDASITKMLPEFFSNVREIENDDMGFLTKPKNPLLIGKLRSGSKTLNVDVFLDGSKALAHHLLIAGTTGRGKSIFISNLLWDIVSKDYCSALVLDPHDEYYGRRGLGLKDHPKKDGLVYYTARNAPAGTNIMAINLDVLRPHHFDGVVDFSDAQKQALNIYYKEFGNAWIESIVLEKKLTMAQFRDDTLAVVKRRLIYTLDLNFSNNQLSCNGVFKLNSGFSTIKDISKHLEEGKIAIIDTSNFSGTTELLIGSLIANEVFNRYRHYKINGLIDTKPVISIVLEEAPRVLGKDVLESGQNIFSTIAREGRKFKVGLTAITQLPSLIPRDILANMNTKVILGIEMKPERQAIIDSASQDLSNDDRTIASLDVGEALVTSNFLKFATPIKIPFFEDVVREYKSKVVSFYENGQKTSIDFSELT